MTIRAILDWANQDSTDDLNKRFEALFAKGVLTGGTIVPISGQLQISLQPFTAISQDGMLVYDDNATLLDIPLDRTNIIAVHAQHQIGDAAIIEVVVIEAGDFAALIDKDYYVVFGAVTTLTPSTEVAETDIDYSLRETQDKRTRDKVRGMVNDILELPSDPNFNVYGDMYVVYSGIGSAPNIYAWDGLAWVNITGTIAVAVALDQHQHNLDTTLYGSDPAHLIGRMHLSNVQKDAALGSVGTPGLTNRYVTQTDPRIPTDSPDGGQSAALLGSDGAPSTTYKYITQAYPIAAPTILSNVAPVLTVIDMSLNGPIYVGKGAVDSANIYFSLLDFTDNRGYLNSTGLPCKINAIYKQVTPTFIKLDPSTDPLVDSYGFYIGPNIWLGIDISVDTTSRLVYGKKTLLKTADHGFPILPTANYEIICGTLLSTISNIKGRLFDESVPTDEQNINLRLDLDNISEYIGTVLETNVVAADEDFIKLATEFPVFEKNIGIDYKFTFENKSTVFPYSPSQLSYTSSTGVVHYYSSVDLTSVLAGDIFIDAEGNTFEVVSITLPSDVVIKNIGTTPPPYPDVVKGAYPESISTSVDGSIIRINVLTFKNVGPVAFTWNGTNVTYSSPVTLSTVNVGDLFRDGGGTKYLITAVNDGADTISIVNIETGIAPLSINTSAGSYLDGSTWINNNPRNLLLSEMKMSFGSEFVPVTRLVRKIDEYSVPEGQVAFGIVRYDNRFDPRIIFYGSWENYQTSTGERYIRNFDGFGKFSVSGYFTDLFLVMRRKTNSGTLTIKIDGVSSATITASNKISSAVAGIDGPKYQVVKLNPSPLDDLLPHTIVGTLPSVVSTDTFDVYGFLFVRSTSATTALLESGRAFEAARIIRRDMPDKNIPIDAITTQGRGGRLAYAVKTNTYSRVINTLNDLDSGGTPTGTCTGSTITITSSGGKLTFYNINDILMVYSTTVALFCRVTGVTISPDVITVDSTSFSGALVNILHICSTDSAVSLSSQEDQIARYILPDDFINHTSTDLALIHQSDRFVVGPDALTIISGQSILVTDANIIGSNKAVQIQQGSAGSLRLTVLATRLDLLCVNSAAATITVSVDGSPSYTFSILGMAQRRTIFSNARYQTHEVTIQVTSVGGTFSIAEMILFGPKVPEFSGFPNVVADFPLLAKYQQSKPDLVGQVVYPTTATNVFPTGAVFKEASMYLSYLNGTGTGSTWSATNDYAKAVTYGRYISSDKEGSYVEFYILNSSFELQYIMGPDHGYFNVFVDGVDIVAMVGITIVGDYTSGRVDGYNLAYARKNIGVYGLTLGLHKVTAMIPTPRAKNGTSSGYKMGFVGYYEGNNNGTMSLGINKYGVYTSVVDTRLFNPLDLTPLDPGVQIAETMTGAAKVNLNIGTTSIVVTLAEPYLDSDYIIVPTLVNTVDTYPLFQSLLLTAQSASGFTLSWNVPTPNGNYSLHYYTRTLDV